jgi:hypothetical protein
MGTLTLDIGLEQLLTSSLLNGCTWRHFRVRDRVSFETLFAVCCADTTIVRNRWQECEDGSLA